MVKRATAGLLWFVATMWLFNFANAFFGVPSNVGFLVAAGFGLFIGGDPLKLYWHPQRRNVAEQPIPRPEFVPVRS
jgi:hypothetical protein